MHCKIIEISKSPFIKKAGEYASLYDIPEWFTNSIADYVDLIDIDSEVYDAVVKNFVDGLSDVVADTTIDLTQRSFTLNDKSANVYYSQRMKAINLLFHVALPELKEITPNTLFNEFNTLNDLEFNSDFFNSENFLSLSKEDKKLVEDMKKFRCTSLTGIYSYIKELIGYNDYQLYILIRKQFYKLRSDIEEESELYYNRTLVTIDQFMQYIGNNPQELINKTKEGDYKDTTFYIGSAFDFHY